AVSSADVETAFDVGAHYDDWSIGTLHAWPRARVHAFEVSPGTFRPAGCAPQAGGPSRSPSRERIRVGHHNGSELMYYFPGHPNLTCDRPVTMDSRRRPFRPR